MSPTPAADSHRKGLLAAWLAYGIWGGFPLYFHALLPSGAWEVLSHRILWTAVLCVVVLRARTEISGLLRTLRRRRLAIGVCVAAYLIAINWGVYVFAVLTGRTNEAALGYFLNPIVTVALGVVVLRERLRPLQWAAVVIGGLAAAYLTLAGGGLPWIALVLACSFALYGLTKKRLGATLPALHSLAGESVALLPVALAIIAWLSVSGTGTFTHDAPLHPLLLVLAGVVTAVPLLLFAEAARRIPLVTIGLIQFITPVVQLLVAVLVLDEHMDPARWVGFAIVWVALAVLSVDSVRVARSTRRARLAPAEPR